MTRTTSENKRGLSALEQIPLSDRNLPTSTYQLLKDSACRFGDKIALRFLPQGTLNEASVSYSYRELVQKITSTANGLHGLGVGANDAVSILLPNLPQTHFALWGAEASGIFNPINPLLDIEHIVAILNEAQTKVLVTLAPSPDSDLWEKAQIIIEKVPSIVAVLTVNLAQFSPSRERTTTQQHLESHLSSNPVRVLDFDDYISNFPDDHLQSQRCIQPEDTASYFHTGGTTGTPKLAPHSHANEITCAWQIAANTEIQEDYVALCGLPLFHVNAVVVTALTPWSVGAEVILASPHGYRTPAVMENFWALVERYRISYFSAVPTILSTLLQFPSSQYDLSSLQYCICGAAPLATELMRNFEARTGLVVIEGYGQTEGTCASTTNPLTGERRIGSVGQALPYMNIRIVKVDAHGELVRDCEIDEAGVIAINGPTVFAGYKQPEQNKGQWVTDGWFNTGDLGRLDKDGYLWLTGRSKDLIIRGGHNIDPQVIEEALYQHPAVAEAAALGKPDARVGELPVAYVVLKTGEEASVESLLKFITTKISERAAIPKEIYLLNEMPMTAVGKIFKPALRIDVTKRTLEHDLRTSFPQVGDVDVRVEQCKKRGLVATLSTSPNNVSLLKRTVQEKLSNYALAIEIKTN